MKIFGAFLLILFLGIGLANINGVVTFPWQDKDRALLKALKSNQLSQFQKLLKQGANPNVIYGIKPSDWVMCEVNKNGKIEFLKLAVKYGGDINLRSIHPITKKIDPLFNSPILCAIVMHNYKAFDLLMQKGVNLNIKVRINAKKIRENHPHIISELWGKTLFGSPVVIASDFNEYHMVYDMLQKKKSLSWEEQYSLKINIETGGIDRKSEANQWRLKVAELLRQRGYEIDPDRGHREFLKKYNVTEEQLEAQRKELQGKGIIK